MPTTTNAGPITTNYLLSLTLEDGEDGVPGGSASLRAMYRAQSPDPHPQLCWQWSGNRDKGGQAMFRILSHMIPAHAVAWVYAQNTLIPDGQWVYRRCQDLNCVNPEHLYLADAPWYTYMENV